MLYDDLVPIRFDVPGTPSEIHVYALGDLHVGAPNWDEKLTIKKINAILDDPVGYVHLCGDLMNNGLKNSKTNTYLETLMPAEQKQWITKNLRPLAARIISAVPGNHEDRTTREVGLSPLYDIMAAWGIEDRYRENLALSVIDMGKNRVGRTVYGGLCTHGSGRNKHQKFITGFDGIDYAVSGHTHTPMYCPHGKICLSLRTKTAKHVGYHEIVVDAGMRPGDYALKREYQISTPPRLDYLTLHEVRKTTSEGPWKTNQRRIDYNSIQI